MTFEGSRGIIFQQITYLFEKCKQCITITVDAMEVLIKYCKKIDQLPVTFR
jgi:hypothetical protein